MEMFVTVGRGLDVFAEKQLELLGAQISLKTEGKIAFSVEDTSRLAELKCVERLFGLVDITGCSSFTKSDLLNHLHKILGSKDGLESAIVQLNPTKKQKLADANTFRLSIKATGKWKKRIDTMRLSKDLSSKVAMCTGWTTDLRNPMVEIIIHLAPEHCSIGIPVFSKPLSFRPYLKHPGLRSTVCDAMISLADLQSGSIVLDLTCGTGTLLLEAAATCPNISAFGFDKCIDSLAIAQDNMIFFEEKLGRKFHVAFAHADATSISLRSPVDRIIADLPFGQNHCTAAEILKLYPLFAKSISRLLNREGTAVLLTSAANEKLLITCCSNESLVLTKKYPLSLGDTDGVICVFKF